MVRSRVAWSVVAVAMVLLCRPAEGLINPKFTPIHLTQDAQVILLLKFEAPAKDGKVTGQVLEVLKDEAKGDFNKKEVVLELAGSDKPDQAKAIEKLVAEGRAKTALFFTAKDDPKVEKPLAYVHMDGSWLVVTREDAGWGFAQTSQEMQGTWNGGSDMLERCVRYILKDEDADVPVKSGTRWADAKVLGKIESPAAVVRPVVLAEPGVPALFVGARGGDKLWVVDKKEASGARAIELPSKSLAATWGDFNGDGRIDLLSWDGKALWLLAQDDKGAFAAPAKIADLAECTSLSTADLGDGKAGVIFGLRSGPRKMAVAAGAAPEILAVIQADNPPDGPCLVADFDGDGQVDVIQLGKSRSMFYPGTKPGAFGAPAACAIVLTEGGQACTGDWDADGLLDVLVADLKAKPKLWHNLGKGQFVESASRSGELYAAKEGSTWVCGGDLNNDGRQDQVVLYGSVGPQVYFNRGFRSFGLSLSMDLGKGELLADLARGAQAGCVADFDGDGCQDLAAVLADGQVALVRRAPRDKDQALHVRLPPASGAGPVRVWASFRDRPLGAWNVTSGSADVMIASPESGPVKLNWQFPGGKVQSKEVVLQNNPVTVVLEK